MKAMAILLQLLLLISSSQGRDSGLNTLIPFNGIGASDDALSVLLNPSGLAFNEGFNGYYIRGYRGSSEGENTFLLSAYGMGLGLQMIEGEGAKLWRWTLSDGERIGEHLAIGTAYSWFSAEDRDVDRLKIWDVGGMFRTMHTSIGLLLRNFNRPRLHGERLKQEINIGLAFRPVNDRLTLSFDTRHMFGEEGWRYRLGAELVPLDGITLRGSIDRERNFDLSLTVDFTHIGFGSYNAFTGEREMRDGLGYLRFSAPLLPTLFSRRREVLRLKSDNALACLRKAIRDKRVLGAVIELDDLSYGLGNLQELEGVIERFRRSGKKAFAYSISLSTGGYLAASACDEVILHPSGQLNLIGIRSEPIFIKQMLDKVGVKPNMERMGEYKSAPETFLRDEMSPYAREEMELVLNDLFDQIKTDISRNRGISPQRLQTLIDRGPYTARKAEKLKLVDELAYRDEIEDIVRRRLGKISFVSGDRYLSRTERIRSWKVPPKVAIINAKGLMVRGESFKDPLTGDFIMGSKTISDALRRAREDKSIKAVVMRIDSGGGMVVAADEIWREVELTRAKKPVVISMGDMAASGGYYIAAPANYIFAQPGTLTGSIGVFSGTVNLQGLYRKLGISKQIIKRGKNADFYSDWSEFTPEKREVLREQVEEIYKSFVDKVSKGRKMNPLEVDKVARGRVWTGRQAKERGLVDELGGLDEAISKAKELAGIREGERVKLIKMPSVKLADVLLRKLLERSGFTRLLKTSNEIMRERFLLIAPYGVEVGD
ncbi:TPA: signal peptide peptidase SppA [Candidatus Poribacteria bacterium]|nr:signal peptide peptidase SppA [Candidatus Poribacteria bacterium]HEX28595.1 signal peptide peptidase SppA [Candidatus Poribacteria bacterium]